MPLKLPDNLPAIELLQKENIFVMDEHRAHGQDIRPLKIVILNPFQHPTANGDNVHEAKVAHAEEHSYRAYAYVLQRLRRNPTGALRRNDYHWSTSGTNGIRRGLLLA